MIQIAPKTNLCSLETGADAAAEMFEKARAAFSARHYQQAIDLADQSWRATLRTCHVDDSTRGSLVNCAIAVVSHKPSVELAATLDQLKVIDGDPSYALLFVNNGNADLEQLLREKINEYIYIDPKFNIGCCGGRNLAAHFATAKYIIFLDDDGGLTTGSVTNLVEVATKHDAFAVRGRVVPGSKDGVAGMHYDLGDKVVPSLPDAEGISIWHLEQYRSNGGFDILLRGHEGIALCSKIIENYDHSKFLYSPESVLYHNYATNERVTEKKRKTQLEMELYLQYLQIDIKRISRGFRAIRNLDKQSRRCRKSTVRQGLFERAKTKITKLIKLQLD